MESHSTSENTKNDSDVTASENYADDSIDHEEYDDYDLALAGALRDEKGEVVDLKPDNLAPDDDDTDIAVWNAKIAKAEEEFAKTSQEVAILKAQFCYTVFAARLWVDNVDEKSKYLLKDTKYLDPKAVSISELELPAFSTAFTAKIMKSFRLNSKKNKFLPATKKIIVIAWSSLGYDLESKLPINDAASRSDVRNYIHKHRITENALRKFPSNHGELCLFWQYLRAQKMSMPVSETKVDKLKETKEYRIRNLSLEEAKENSVRPKRKEDVAVEVQLIQGEKATVLPLYKSVESNNNNKKRKKKSKDEEEEQVENDEETRLIEEFKELIYKRLEKKLHGVDLKSIVITVNCVVPSAEGSKPPNGKKEALKKKVDKKEVPAKKLKRETVTERPPSPTIPLPVTPEPLKRHHSIDTIRGTYPNANYTSLDDNNELGDEVMNMYMLTLSEQSTNKSQFKVYSTLLYPDLLSGRVEPLEKVEHDFVIIPLNSDKAHWSLIVYCVKAGACIVFDSLSPAMLDLKSFDRFLGLQKVMIRVPNVPQQDNAYDCGVFMLHFYEYILEHPEDLLKYCKDPKKHPLVIPELDASKKRTEIKARLGVAPASPAPSLDATQVYETPDTLHVRFPYTPLSPRRLVEDTPVKFTLEDVVDDSIGISQEDSTKVNDHAAEPATTTKRKAEETKNKEGAKKAATRPEGLDLLMYNFGKGIENHDLTQKPYTMPVLKKFLQHVQVDFDRNARRQDLVDLVDLAFKKQITLAPLDRADLLKLCKRFKIDFNKGGSKASLMDGLRTETLKKLKQAITDLEKDDSGSDQ